MEDVYDFKEKIENLQILHFHESYLLFHKKIGYGSFGKVFLGSYKSTKLAIKTLKNPNLKDFFREIILLKRFKHRHVPNFLGISPTNSKKPSLITELIQGNNLDTYFRIYSPSDLEILIHLLDLSSVLEYLHSNNLIHRDLKPSNIMIDRNYDIKLLDFGISKVTDKSSTNTITLGTLIYMAPENFHVSIENEGLTSHQSRINNKVDVWAFGLIMSELFSKVKPWENIAEDQNGVIGLLFSGKKFEIPSQIHNFNIRNLIEKCTRVDPGKRLSMNEVKEFLLKELFENVKGQMDKMLFMNVKDSRKRFCLINKLYNYLNIFKKIRRKQSFEPNFLDLKVIYKNDYYFGPKKQMILNILKENCQKIIGKVEDIDLGKLKSFNSESSTRELTYKSSESFFKCDSVSFVSSKSFKENDSD